MGRAVDLDGYLVLPGIIDLHGDGFERHLAPRRGAMTDMAEGIVATEAELAANGITTGVLAQFLSWEGGLRGGAHAAGVFAAIRDTRGSLATTLIPQLRFETHMLEEYATLPERLAEWGVNFVVFNDHLPHDRLAEGRRPPSLTGQALKAGRSPEAHLALLQELHARGPEVPAALDALCARLLAQGVRIGSHDDHTAEDRAQWAARGAAIAEFPETETAARAAKADGGGVVLGSPNVVRGGSHKGNASAGALVAMGLCDALASDYHYPSPRRAALALAREMGLEAAWALVSSGPARLLGLADRGELAPGKRVDIVILEAATGRVAGTLAGGRFSYLGGALAGRFLA
ncbi:alpha-D-ribose 1-methylphosphonate 5-triphosphate diphosphatase [Seohaeicola zhoushanensis]